MQFDYNTNYTLCRPAGRRRMALAKQSIATTVEGYDPFSNLCGAVHRNSFLGSGLHFTGRPGSHTRDTLEIIIERAAVAILLPNRPRSARVLPTARSALLVCPISCLAGPLSVASPAFLTHLVTDTLRCTGLRPSDSAGVTANNHTPQVRLPLACLPQGSRVYTQGTARPGYQTERVARSMRRVGCHIQLIQSSTYSARMQRQKQN